MVAGITWWQYLEIPVSAEEPEITVPPLQKAPAPYYEVHLVGPSVHPMVTQWVRHTTSYSHNPRLLTLAMRIPGHSPEGEPAYHVVPSIDNPGWWRSAGRPHQVQGMGSEDGPGPCLAARQEAPAWLGSKGGCDNAPWLHCHRCTINHFMTDLWGTEAKVARVACVCVFTVIQMVFFFIFYFNTHTYTYM